MSSEAVPEFALLLKVGLSDAHIKAVAEAICRAGLQVQQVQQIGTEEKEGPMLLLSASEERLQLEAKNQCLVVDLPRNPPDAFDFLKFAIGEREVTLMEMGQFSPDVEGRTFRAWERSFLVCRIVLDHVFAKDCITVEEPRATESLVHGLMREKTLLAFFPLHNKETQTFTAQLLNFRDDKNSFLLSNDGLDALAQAYGTEAAMYFVFMRAFTMWLIPPGLAGFFIWLFRPPSVTADDDVKNAFFSIAMMLWAAAFPSLVLRAERSCACRWGTLEGERHEEKRPEFRGELRPSPVTGEQEPYYPTWKRQLSYCVSVVVTLVMLGIASSVMICLLNLQGYMAGEDSTDTFYIPILAQWTEPGRILDPTGNGDPFLFGFITFLPVVLYVVVVRQLNAWYRGIALVLTEWENHDEETTFENALGMKRFFFEAFDCYIALFYVAFVLRDPVKLREELMSIFMADTIRRVLTESVIPWVSIRRAESSERKKLAARKKDDNTSQLPADLTAWRKEALRDDYEPFDDYLEMVIEFGYVTLFASMFPAGACVAIAANVVECYSDIFKLEKVSRRPKVDRRANSMTKPWFRVLQGMVWLSIATNCLLMGFSSHQLAQLVPAAHYAKASVACQGGCSVWFLVALEHAAGLLALLVTFALPTTPMWVKNALLSRIHRRKLQRKRVAMQLSGNAPEPCLVAAGSSGGS